MRKWKYVMHKITVNVLYLWIAEWIDAQKYRTNVINILITGTVFLPDSAGYFIGTCFFTTVTRYQSKLDKFITTDNFLTIERIRKVAM